MPIIVGVGRSGTTLLRLMLDAHPALAIPPETGFLEPVTRLSVGGEAAREVFFQTVTGVPHWPDARVPADALDEALRSRRTTPGAWSSTPPSRWPRRPGEPRS
jgi:hypothetical protein